MNESTPKRTDMFAASLKRLLPGGLPAELGSVDLRLLRLRGVIARSADPDDQLSQLAALNKLLVQQVTKIPFYRQRDLAAAAVTLFGLTKVSRRLNLTERYEEAAKLAGYNRDHFRQVIVAKILLQLATQLLQDSARYSGRRAPQVEITGDGPQVTADHLSTRETALLEEAKSRIWENVHGLRAGLIAVRRLQEWPEAEHGFLKLEEARESTLWYLARLLACIHSFLNTYGPTIAMGTVEYNAEGLIRLAGWTGELPPEMAYKARMLAAQEPTKEGFLRAAKESQLIILGVGD